MEWILAAAGLIILIFAGDSLVKGAVNLALRLGRHCIAFGQCFHRHLDDRQGGLKPVAQQ